GRVVLLLGVTVPTEASQSGQSGNSLGVATALGCRRKTRLDNATAKMQHAIGATLRVRRFVVGRPRTPGRDWMRHRLALQSGRVHGVSGITGGANGDADPA